MDIIDIKDLPDDGPVVLIDADSLLYFEMGKPTLEEAIAGIDHRILTMLNVNETCNFAGFLTIGRCFRYNAAKTKNYKYNRKHGSKPIIFYALKEYLQQHWNFIYMSELEADDLVAVYGDGYDGNTVICSPDKDVIYQVPGVHFNYRTAEHIHTTPDQAEKFLWKQMLMGDSTDGIQGIPKVGEKTADKWLSEVALPEMPMFVLEKYVEKFGIPIGISKFAETFKLIYILKSKEDVLQEVDIKLPELVVNNVKLLNKEQWQ